MCASPRLLPWDLPSGDSWYRISDLLRESANARLFYCSSCLGRFPQFFNFPKLLKLLPLSDLIWRMLHLLPIKLCNVSKKESVSRESVTSIWISQLQRHLNMTPSFVSQVSLSYLRDFPLKLSSAPIQRNLYMLQSYYVGRSLSNRDTKGSHCYVNMLNSKEDPIRLLTVSHQRNPESVFKYSWAQQNNVATIISRVLPQLCVADFGYVRTW